MERASASSDLDAPRDAALTVLRDGGSALRAALTGFFVAAGESRGVLLSPVTVLVGGVGQGARAFDGRVRQPGLGEKRPRGFLPTDRIPAAARVAIPESVAALAVASAYQQGASLAAPARQGAQAARRVGGVGRARLLDLVASLGGPALADPRVVSVFAADFGAAEGGTVTAADLRATPRLDHAASEDGVFLRPPWQTSRATAAELGSPNAGAAGGDGPGAGPLGPVHGVIAVDAMGLFVAISFSDLAPDVLLGDYEVAVPLLGTPVRRGEPRTAPGSVVESPAPVELERDEEGRIIAVRADTRLGTLALHRDPQSKLVG